MFWVYNFLLTLASPFWVPWMLWRTSRRKEKPNWRERQGEYVIERAKRPRLWFHAVSVGEVVAGTAILKEVRRIAPEIEIVLTVTTSSGHRTAVETAVGLYDHLFYFPIDVVRFQVAALSRVWPDAIAIMETELWMNFLAVSRNMGIRSLLVNGRISDRAYPRARRVAFFYRSMLRNLDRGLMQSERDATRIAALGAREVEVLGNCKFDQAGDAKADVRAWRKELGLSETDRVVVVGSTRGEEEEALVAQALADPRLADVKVVWAPRHLERVPALVERYPNAALRSSGSTGPMLLLDTYGELAQVYAVADVVVVGGGFAKLGGQNLIQPLALGKPVVHGPHMANFRDVAESATAGGASLVAQTSAELADALARLLGDDEARRAMATAARELVRRNLGAATRYATEIVAEVRAAYAKRPRRRS